MRDCTVVYAVRGFKTNIRMPDDTCNSISYLFEYVHLHTNIFGAYTEVFEMRVHCAIFG